jgi:hypothetical protein
MVPPKARLIILVLAGVLVVASGALAQRVISAKAGFVYYVQGRAFVEGGRLKTGESFRQLKAGENLSTERGRAEVLLNPGTVLRLGEMSRLHMDNINLTDACVSLESGSAVITVNSVLKTDHIRLIAGGNVIVMERAGVYRLDVTQGRLRVFSGRAEVRREGSAALVTVKRGHAVNLDDGLSVAKFNLKDTDALQLWASARSRVPLVRGYGLRLQPPRVAWQGNDPAPKLDH